MPKEELKKGQNHKSFQTKLPMYYANKEKSAMKEDNKDGWTVGERVEMRHANEHHKEEKREEKKEEVPPTIEPRPSSNNSHTEHLSNLSARSSSPGLVIEKKEPPRRSNVDFYLNKMPSQPYGEYIDIMHQKWYNNYQKLERDHAFIQWIFPNSFQSRFNVHAKPLTHEQAEQFRTNPEIIKRYLKSYDMMLAFYGFRLKDKHTGELMRSRHPNYKERFYKTLVTSWHNHMRITRILCSLKETGFGRYASELCKILKFEIYDQYGEMNALKKYNVYKDWQPFQCYVEGNESLNWYMQRINKKKEHHHHQQKHEGNLVVPKADEIREPRSKSSERGPGHRGQK